MTSDRRPVWESERPAIRWGAYAWAFVGMALAFVLVWRGLGYLRLVVAPLSVAIFLAAVLVPPARALERRGWPPALAAFALLLTFVVVLAAIGFVITMSIQAHWEDLQRSFQEGYRQLQPRLDAIPLLPDADTLFGPVTGEAGGQTGGGAAGAGDSEGAAQGTAQAAAVTALRTLGRLVTEFFLFLVATFFYVKDRGRIARWLVRLFSADRREDAAEVLRRTWETVGGYIRGQALIAAVDGVFIAIGLLLQGIPLAIGLGVVVFLGAFVPVAGAIVSGALAVAVALAAEGVTAGLITLAIVVAVQQLEGHVLAPIVLGRTVRLHPVAVLAAITAGAVLLGVWGAVIAVPLTASVHHAVSYLRAAHPEVAPAPPRRRVSAPS